MTAKADILKLWLAHLLLLPVFALGLWVIGVPVGNRLILVFLAIAFPLFALVAAVAGSSLSSLEVDERGLSTSFPLANRVLWSEIQSVHARWPYVMAKAEHSNVLLPGRWLLKNRNDVVRVLRTVADSNESAKKLLTRWR